MTWYADGSTYSYGGSPVPNLVCAGWLGEGHPFRAGKAPDGFADRLAWRCLNQYDRGYRGIHDCELCPTEPTDVGSIFPFPYANRFVSILHAGKKHVLGSAEITVEATQRIYAAPNLVLHYVVEHGYLPPDDFVDAIMTDSAGAPLHDWCLSRGPYWDE